MEMRLDAAFQNFVNANGRRRGWNPIWTPNLRAEVWARFALYCRQLVNESGVPAPYRQFDIEGISSVFPVQYRSLAQEFILLLESPRMLAINGKRGTGKTTLAYGAVIKFCNLGRRAVYRTVAEFFQELSDAPWERKQEIRRGYFSPELLVLDEIQVRDSDREWQDNELTTLIDKRYRENKATILLSNLLAAELRANLGDSIWRRLIETGGEPIRTEWDRIEVIKQRLELARRPKHESPKLALRESDRGASGPSAPAEPARDSSNAEPSPNKGGVQLSS